MQMRPAHAAPKGPFESFAKCVTHVLQQRLRKFKHIYTSVGSVVQHLRTLKLHDGCIFVHYDIADFYMAGTSSFVSVHVTAIIGTDRLRMQVY